MEEDDSEEDDAVFQDHVDMDDLDRAMEEGSRGQVEDGITFAIAARAAEDDDFAFV